MYANIVKEEKFVKYQRTDKIKQKKFSQLNVVEYVLSASFKQKVNERVSMCHVIIEERVKFSQGRWNQLGRLALCTYKSQSFFGNSCTFYCCSGDFSGASRDFFLK